MLRYLDSWYVGDPQNETIGRIGKPGLCSFGSFPLLYYHFCLQFSYLMSDWLLPQDTNIAFLKYFRCLQFSQFDSNI